MTDENAHAAPAAPGGQDDHPQPYGQAPPPGQTAYGQPAGPYGQTAGPYGQPDGPYGQPAGPYGPPAWQQPGANPPPGYPPAGYPPPGYPPVQQFPQTETMAIASLIVSVVGTVIAPVIAHIVALVLVSQAKKNIRASGGRLTGEGLAVAAQVVSWIVIIGGVLFALAYVAIIVIAISQSPS